MAVARGTHGERTTSRLFVASVAVTATQVIHGLTPADTDAEGYVGLVAGSMLLVASLAAIIGLRMGRPWARNLAGGTGLVVAGGFVLYHSLPFDSPVTNPYFGEGVGVLPWITVALCIGAGLWAGYEAFGFPPRLTPSTS